MKSVSHVTNLKHVRSVSYGGTWVLSYRGRRTSISVVYNSAVSATGGRVVYLFWFYIRVCKYKNVVFPEVLHLSEETENVFFGCTVTYDSNVVI